MKKSVRAGITPEAKKPGGYAIKGVSILEGSLNTVHLQQPMRNTL